MLAHEATRTAIADEFESFEMPGFLRRSAPIADAGLYGVRRRRDEVLRPLLNRWRLCKGADSGDAVDDARRRIDTTLVRLDEMVRRFESTRRRRNAKHLPAAG